jgi:class 3 adenylate cyclase
VEARASEVHTLPAGFVTFLLTDIEDSTGLIQRLGDEYSALLNDVRSILRVAVNRAGGREVDARADEFFAVFERAEPAVDVALAVQRAVRDRAWPGQADVRLRVGIHAGWPTLTDTGYVGLAVHTAARVSSVARGGQVLLSAAAHGSLVKLPAGVSARSLGAHRLRSIPEPVELFEVVAEGLLEFGGPRVTGASDPSTWTAATDDPAGIRRA